MVAAVRVVFHTEWSVVQERSAARGDFDSFIKLRHGDSDWIDAGGGDHLDLADIVSVDLTFGTFINPNYVAVVTSSTGTQRHFHGQQVILLQHELLQRATQHTAR